MKNAFNPPLGHALFLFHLALSVFPDIGSVGQVEKKKKKPLKKRRPGTPASLVWSLERTRHEPKINMVEKLVFVCKIKTTSEKGSTIETVCCYYAHFYD